MTRKHRIILLVVVFWSVVLGVPSVWLWRADRQERLNRQLIAAIKREDTPAALLTLERGADANARDEPRVPAWKRLWDFVRGRRAATSKASTALLLSVKLGQLTFDDPQLISTLLAHGSHINEVDQYNCAPLFWALLTGNKRIARLLVDRGANVNDVGSGANLLALEIGTCQDTALTELMLEHGADCNNVGWRGTWSPLELPRWMRSSRNRVPSLAP